MGKWGATMRAGAAAAFLAASLLSHAGWADCTPRRTGNCVNLDLVPQVSQRIVDDEPLAAPRKIVPKADTPATYTGPTVGAAPNVRRAPTVGYRWSID